MKIIISLLFLFLHVGTPTVRVYGGEPIAIFGDWYFFKYVNKEYKLLCYIMSIPKSRYDNFSRRGQSFFTVIQEGESNYHEIYSSFGIVYNRDIIGAEIEVAKHRFPLLTFRDKIWAYNKNDDKQIIEQIKKTLFFSIVVNYENNKNLMDVYSSTGFSEAIEYLSKNCR
jgi:hypothetical protein